MKHLRWAARTAALAGAAASGFMYSWQVEPRWVRINRVSLPIPDLPPAFDGYRIALISDLHLDGAATLNDLADTVRQVNEEHADLILIPGDFSTHRRDNRNLLGSEDILARLHAPDGVWASLGNHDYYAGIHVIEKALADANITLLKNENRLIQRDGGEIALAAIDDVICGVPNLPQALDGIPDDIPVILMAHEPDFARIAAADARVRLQVSGHTHGGQIRLPVVSAMVLPSFGHMYVNGGYQVNDMALYVSTGIGMAGLPLRFNCRPEITVITLERGTDIDRRVWRLKSEVE
jgi:predicted MPP superfamily phosphohydrolase